MPFLLLFIIPICFTILTLQLSVIKRDRNQINNMDYLDIVYCPNNSYTNTLMERAGDYFATKYRHRIIRAIAVNSEQNMSSFISRQVLEEKRQIRGFIAIDFGADWHRGQVDANGAQPPEHLHYSLSIKGAEYNNGEDYDHRLIQPKVLVYLKYDNYRNPYDIYIESCFCKIQVAIDLAHISLVSNTSVDNIDVYHQFMPLPVNYINENTLYIRENLYYWAIIIILFALLVMLPVSVKRIVEDRQTRITDYLFQLGISRAHHWITIIIDSLTVIGRRQLV
ncbi:unnamed protein product [Oppiella nova]|uniref:Uncharacterized protein n=1 Tax=Oppiella nova TaxID=334625 RepID=A0A7R9QN29_9ACAR|nr:unnamed protein product [Oppiella nova]CAG2169300.1 unnamed protein product [Oppiella nova]